MRGSISIGYASDGPYFKGQEEYFRGCDYLILNTMMPKGEKSEKHLNVDGAVKLINGADPKVAILQHFGFTFMRAGFESQRSFVEEATGVKTLRANDGMEIDLEEAEKKEESLEKFLR